MKNKKQSCNKCGICEECKSQNSVKEEIDYTINQAINHAFSGDVSNMSSDIENALKGKIFQALENKRIEIAKNTFNNQEEI